jgi:hypothetical protein
MSSLRSQAIFSGVQGYLILTTFWSKALAPPFFQDVFRADASRLPEKHLLHFWSGVFAKKCEH